MRPIATPSRGTIQRFGWALHDSDDMDKSDVVDKNLIRARSKYLSYETTTDANKLEELKPTVLVPGEAIHLHAHGHELALSNLSVATMANVLKTKFGLANLKGRVIVMHSCETGKLTYGGDVLGQLVQLGKEEGVDLRGTTVYAPENYLVVEKDDGLSYVAKKGVELGDLRSDDRKQYLRPLGQGWKGWTVNKQHMVVSTSGDGVVAVMQFDENTLKPKLEGKKKLEGKSKGWNVKKNLKVEEEEPMPKVRLKPRSKVKKEQIKSEPKPWELGYVEPSIDNGGDPSQQESYF